MARINADPARVAARQAKANVARNTAEHRSLRSVILKRQWGDPQMAAVMTRAGAQNGARTFTDPEMRLKGLRTRCEAQARETAARVGIPLATVAEFRALRRHRFTIDEARDVLRASYPALFAALDTGCHEAALRARGPMPAIGTPQRARWSRRVAVERGYEAVSISSGRVAP